MGPANENNMQPAKDDKQATKDNKKPKNDPNVLVIPNINPSDPTIVIENNVPPGSGFSPGPLELAAPSPEDVVKNIKKKATLMAAYLDCMARAMSSSSALQTAIKAAQSVLAAAHPAPKNLSKFFFFVGGRPILEPPTVRGPGGGGSSPPPGQKSRQIHKIDIKVNTNLNPGYPPKLPPPPQKFFCLL